MFSLSAAVKVLLFHLFSENTDSDRLIVSGFFVCFTENPLEFLPKDLSFCTMICSVKQSPTITNGCDIFLRSKTRPSVQGSLHLPSLPLKKFQRSVLSVQKPLHVSSIGSFGSLARKSLIRCQAYEADRSEPVESNIELPKVETRSEAAKKLKIGVYFAMWWALNVVFNIYNKKVLNAYPFPWLTSTLSLACGSLIMLVSWATRIAEAPKTDMEFWKALFPVS